MKVQELRQLMEAADMEHLMKAFAESYKQLKKGQREEIDPVLINILKGNEIEKKKEEAVVDFGELAGQVDDFIKNAYAQNYFAPNRVIPKSQRSKWRFMVKNFIKELDKVSVRDANYPKAAKLMEELYQMLCDGCKQYLFSTDDPFRSIGWDQAALFELVLKKTFAAGYRQEDIVRLLLQAIDAGLSTESLQLEQELVFIDSMKTREAKELAACEARKLIAEREKQFDSVKKRRDGQYYMESAVNELCTVLLGLSARLADMDQGVEYFFKHYREERKEAVLYHALSLLDQMEEDDLWIAVYEYAIQRKIEPYDAMKRSYEDRKKWL